MRSHRLLFGFVALILAVGLACGGTTTQVPPTPIQPAATSVPVQQDQGNQQQPPTQDQQQQQTSNSGGSSTFVDQNNLLAFDIPSDWKVEHTEQGNAIYTDTNAYTDTFTSPDGSAKIESLVMFADAGVTVNNSTSQAVALDILNTYYSNTGKNNGDIRISSDQIMQDGSERFEWKSKTGGYSGVSFFEVRGNDKRTWLMWTAWWSDSSDQSNLDVINNAINTYRVP